MYKVINYQASALSCPESLTNKQDDLVNSVTSLIKSRFNVLANPKIFMSATGAFSVVSFKITIQHMKFSQ